MTRYVLRSSPASPFGRKVKIAATLLGLWDRLDVQAADTTDPADTVRAQNPLGKIPVLLLPDGSAIYDSRVIVDWLDALAEREGLGSRLIPPPSDPARWTVLTRLALADGIADAALLLVYEGRLRPEGMRSQPWMDNQQSKIDRALAAIEAAPPAFGPVPDAGCIALACALGYLDLRHGGRWRAAHPGLVAWLARFAATVPAFEETRPA
jgi:glutathione S-transferase